MKTLKKVWYIWFIGFVVTGGIAWYLVSDTATLREINSSLEQFNAAAELKIEVLETRQAALKEDIEDRKREIVQISARLGLTIKEKDRLLSELNARPAPVPPGELQDFADCQEKYKVLITDFSLCLEHGRAAEESFRLCQEKSEGQAKIIVNQENIMIDYQDIVRVQDERIKREQQAREDLDRAFKVIKLKSGWKKYAIGAIVGAAVVWALRR